MFLRFTPGTRQSLGRPWWTGSLGLLVGPAGGGSLDLDSRGAAGGLATRRGQGIPSRRPGRNRHPLLAARAEAPCVLPGWRRSGNAGAWGGLDKHNPLFDALCHWPKPTPPKLDAATNPSGLTE